MAQVLNINPSHHLNLGRPSRSRPFPPPPIYGSTSAVLGNPNPRWTALLRQLKCEGRHSCFFESGRKQDQARKALENALGGKKDEFEKWNKEIERKEEMGRGGASGNGGWFGGGGWFGWFGGDHFWEEAQQAVITILGVVSLFLLITRGNALLAVVINPLLFVLRGVRNWFAFFLSSLSRTISPSGSGIEPGSAETASGVHQSPPMTAKERVVKKWGMD